MTTELPAMLVVNGGSSSGKSTLARALQVRLPGIWLVYSVDALVDALPPEGGGIAFGPGGEVVVDDRFAVAEAAWRRGLAAMSRHGVHVVVDDVFLGGKASQDRWRDALDGDTVRWIGVRCDPDVAAAREATRGDRQTGMARAQAGVVHDGVEYDLEVDTSDVTPEACAQRIAAWLTSTHT